MSKISLIFHKFHHFENICFFFLIMFNLSKITLTAVCFGKISSENQQTNCLKDRQTDSLEKRALEELSFYHPLYVRDQFRILNSPTEKFQNVI